MTRSHRGRRSARARAELGRTVTGRASRRDRPATPRGARVDPAIRARIRSIGQPTPTRHGVRSSIERARGGDRSGRSSGDSRRVEDRRGEVDRPIGRGLGGESPRADGGVVATGREPGPGVILARGRGDRGRGGNVPGGRVTPRARRPGTGHRPARSRRDDRSVDGPRVSVSVEQPGQRRLDGGRVPGRRAVGRLGRPGRNQADRQEREAPPENREPRSRRRSLRRHDSPIRDDMWECRGGSGSNASHRVRSHRHHNITPPSGQGATLAPPGGESRVASRPVCRCGRRRPGRRRRRPTTLLALLSTLPSQHRDDPTRASREVREGVPDRPVGSPLDEQPPHPGPAVPPASRSPADRTRDQGIWPAGRPSIPPRRFPRSRGHQPVRSARVMGRADPTANLERVARRHPRPARESGPRSARPSRGGREFRPPRRPRPADRVHPRPGPGRSILWGGLPPWSLRARHRPPPRLIDAPRALDPFPGRPEPHGEGGWSRGPTSRNRPASRASPIADVRREFRGPLRFRPVPRSTRTDRSSGPTDSCRVLDILHDSKPMTSAIEASP